MVEAPTEMVDLLNQGQASALDGNPTQAGDSYLEFAYQFLYFAGDLRGIENEGALQSVMEVWNSLREIIASLSVVIGSDSYNAIMSKLTYELYRELYRKVDSRNVELRSVLQNMREYWRTQSSFREYDSGTRYSEGKNVESGVIQAQTKNIDENLVSLVFYLRSGGEAEGLIRRISSNVNPESDRTLIKSAKKTIEILDINALGPLHHSREALIEFLKKNEGTLRILLLDPEGEKFQERVDKEGDVDGRILSEWRASIGILREISRRGQGRGTFDFRLYDDRPKVNLLIADGSEEEGLMLINYYPAEPGTRGYEGDQFLAKANLSRDQDSFKRNLDYFNELWASSRDVDIYQLEID